MTPRERTLAVVVLALILVVGGGLAAYAFVYSPLQDKEAALKLLRGEIDGTAEKAGLEAEAAKRRKDRPQMAAVKRQSLPPDDAQAKAQYKLLLERLLLQAGLTDIKIPDATAVNSRPPVTPEMAPKKPAYRAFAFRITITKANIWQLTDFLYAYYQLDLLHQITDLKITREKKVEESRGWLKVEITSEAIILDGAESRTALFPVSPAIAAAAGNLGIQALAARPEMLRKLTSTSATPVLAARPRDYSLIPYKDVFYGLLPPAEKPVPFAIGRVSDVVLKRDEKAQDIKVRLTGEGAAGGTVTATAAGSLLPEGELKVDPKTLTISVPGVGEDMTDSATSTVSLVATAADGKTSKSSFKVSVEKTTAIVEKLDDISGSIRLIMAVTGSDGTATALVRDMANPFRYEIAASIKGVAVTKHWALGKLWKLDRDYDHPAGVLMISDDGATATRRMFRVVAIDNDGVVVADLGGPDAAKPDGKQPAKGGPRPPGGGPKPGGGKAEPLAGVAGNLATAIPAPTLYRWVPGKSLKELLDPKGPYKLSPDDARAVLRRVAADGPIGGATVTSSRN